MGFFTKLYELLFGKKETSHEDEYIKTHGSSRKVEEPVKKVVIKKPQYRKIPRTKETNQFVDYMMKKASSPDPKAVHYKDTTDLGHITKITNKLKEDISKK